MAIITLPKLIEFTSRDTTGITTHPCAAVNYLDMSEWEFVKAKKKRKQTQKTQPAAQRGQNGRVTQAKLDRAVYLSSSTADNMEGRDSDRVDEAALSSLVLQVASARQAVRSTSFFRACVSALGVSLAAKERGGGGGREGGALFSRAVLLGLGHFSHMPCILQLALALELLTEQTLFHRGASTAAAAAVTYDCNDSSCSGPGDEQQQQPWAYIYDPVMTTLDAALCSALGLTVITDSDSDSCSDRKDSEESTTPAYLQPLSALTDSDLCGGGLTSSSSSSSGNTLFYMPHCPYLLYNHVIWTHWAPRHLVSMTILGNSFDSYNMRHLGQSSSSAAPAASWDCVQNLADILSEQSVWQQQKRQGGEAPCLAYMENAFNDMRYVWDCHAPATLPLSLFLQYLVFV